MKTFLDTGELSAGMFLRGMDRIGELIRQMRNKLRRLFYGAALFAMPCPSCGRPNLRMLRDSWCRCDNCGHELDPTLVFQGCTGCGGSLRRRIHHYWCDACKQRIRSAFCFDAKVFDADYFRRMMQESRARKRQKREQLKKMLANARSGAYILDHQPQLADVPGLAQALDEYVSAPVPAQLLAEVTRRPFDLEFYRKHILELVSGCVVRFDGIARLIGDPRLDRVYRFITVIFMQHRGEIVLEQTEPYGGIVIHENETDRKGQAIH